MKNSGCKTDADARELSQSQIELLGRYQYVYHLPEDIRWEIKVYRYIMDDDSLARLNAYSEARMDHVNKRMVPKREAVRKLGWEIK